MQREAQGASRGDCRNAPIGPIKHDRLVSIARKFGDGAERAEAPCDLVAGDLFGEKIQEIGHHITLWLRGVGLGGAVPVEDAAAGDATPDGEPPAVSLMPP